MASGRLFLETCPDGADDGGDGNYSRWWLSS